MRFFLILFLIINGFFIFTKDVKAYTCGSLYCASSGTVSGCVSANGALSGTPSIDSADEGCCTSWCVQQLSCNTCDGFTDDQKCNKGASSTNCGVGFCSSDRSECCSTGSNWTKYKVNCVNTSTSYFLICTQQWVVAGKQCSIGDKIKSSQYGLNSSGCECDTTGGLYKCCYNSNGDLENAIGTPSLDDGYGDPEGTCPGGSSIDGVRVKSPVGGVCVPKATCPAAQACPTTCHTTTTTVPNGSCGTTTCPPNAPPAQTCTVATCGQSLPNGSCGTITCPACATGQTMYYCTTSSGTNNCLSTSSTYTSVSTCNSNLDTYVPTHTGSCFTSESSCDFSCNPPPTGGCVPTTDCSSAASGCVGTSCNDGCNNITYGTVNCSGGGACIPWSCSVTNGSCSSSSCNSGSYSFTSSSTHYDYWRCLGSP